jgi:AraC-like DNA-binding protein
MPAPAEWVARAAPFGPVGPKRTVRLDVAKLSPVVRIAHRRTMPLNMPERILFDHEIVLFLQGRGVFRFGDQALPISPHALFVVPPFTPHKIDGEKLVEHVAIHFDPGVLPHAVKPSRRGPYEVRLSHGLSLPRRVDLSPDDGIEADCLELVRAFAAIEPFAETEAAAILTRILITLIRKRPEPEAVGDGQGRVRVLVDKAIAFIEANAAEKLSAEDLANQAGLSESHFNRVFRAQTGYAPMEYLRRYRVQRAKDLLANADLAVKEIARQAGFDDAYHFSKVFRQIAGVTPTAYRDGVLSGRSL